MTRTLAMERFILILSAAVWLVNGIIYIDRFTLVFNEQICNWSISFLRFEKESSKTNVTFKPFKTVTKLLTFLTVKVAEDSNDREYRRVFVRTVFDCGKLFDGSSGNPILRRIIERLQKTLNYPVTFPMEPVSQRKTNNLNVNKILILSTESL